MNRIAAVSLLALAPSLVARRRGLPDGRRRRSSGEIVEHTADADRPGGRPGPRDAADDAAWTASSPARATSASTMRARRPLPPRRRRGLAQPRRWARGPRSRHAGPRGATSTSSPWIPTNAAAHLALGHVRMGDRWVSGAEAYRARGFVQFEGTWMTPEERQRASRSARPPTQERQAMREATRGPARPRPGRARPTRAAQRRRKRMRVRPSRPGRGRRDPAAATATAAATAIGGYGPRTILTRLATPRPRPARHGARPCGLVRRPPQPARPPPSDAAAAGAEPAGGGRSRGLPAPALTFA